MLATTTLMWSALWALALADPPPRLEGFVRLWADPDTLEVIPTEPAPSDGEAVLEVHNPHVARSVVQVGEVTVGALDPLATGVLRGVPAGTYTVVFTTPLGFERPVEVATAPHPPGSSPPSE